MRRFVCRTEVFQTDSRVAQAAKSDASVCWQQQNRRFIKKKDSELASSDEMTEEALTSREGGDRRQDSLASRAGSGFRAQPFALRECDWLLLAE